MCAWPGFFLLGEEEKIENGKWKIDNEAKCEEFLLIWSELFFKKGLHVIKIRLAEVFVQNIVKDLGSHLRGNFSYDYIVLQSIMPCGPMLNAIIF